MTPNRTYLDHNASAPLLPKAREAMVAALSVGANASSIHADGRKTRSLIEMARKNIASLVGSHADQVIFTSGATEAAQLALSPILHCQSGELSIDRLFVSAGEHPCIFNGGRFSKTQIEVVPVTSTGLVDIDVLAALFANKQSGGAFLAAVMLANNETGIIQPIKDIAKMVHEAGGYLLVDAVQAAGRIPLDMASIGADFLILSSHKIGGPQGAGALILGDKSLKPAPLIKGGGQEFQLRAGTENLAAIAGFGSASLWAQEQLEHIQQVRYVRDSFEARLAETCKTAGNHLGPLVIIGKDCDRLANTCCFSVAGINAETALISLDLDGISVSSGSACSSGRVELSHVLKAMGLSERVARGAIRVSMGWDTTLDDTEKFLEAWSSYLKRLT